MNAIETYIGWTRCCRQPVFESHPSGRRINHEGDDVCACGDCLNSCGVYRASKPISFGELAAGENWTAQEAVKWLASNHPDMIEEPEVWREIVTRIKEEYSE